MTTKVTLSEAAVMLLIYDHESERNGTEILRRSRELDVLRLRQIALRKMIASIKEKL